MALNDILNDDQYLAETEAAPLLGYKNHRTLKRHRDLGIAPPYIRIGRKVYYRRGAIREHLLAKEKEARQ